MRLHFLAPGDLLARTGGNLYDRRIVEGLRTLGWTVDLHDLGACYPTPGATSLAQAARIVQALPDGACVVADGLAFCVLPELAHAHARRLDWIALVHHPLALETGLGGDLRQRLFDSERLALAAARGIVVTSPSTARALAAYDVDAGRIAVVEPGTAPADLSQGSKCVDGGLSLLCVASLTPRKGHALLVEALAGLADRRWQLHCAGSETLDPACAAAVRDAVARHGLGDRVHFHGELDAAALAALYARADAFVLPSYHEGYGMALAEALARGLPVLSSSAGAIPDTVPADAGWLMPPGDLPAWRTALARLLGDPGGREALREGASAARTRLPDWPVSSERFAAAVGRFARVSEAAR